MSFSGITLVTGAAGFMGSHLVEYLVSRGVRVRATARPRRDTSFFARLGVEYVPADLTRPETLPPLFAGGVDRVFHLGAIGTSPPYARLTPPTSPAWSGSGCAGHGVKLTSRRLTSVRPLPGVPFRNGPRNPRTTTADKGTADVVRAHHEGRRVTRPCPVYVPL